MKLYDISPEISPAMAVWPGDTSPQREVLLDMRRGDNLTLSTLHTTVHAGAHADAPSHYGTTAPTIEQRDLRTYLGPAQVLDCPAAPGTRVGPEILARVESTTRLLLRTGTYPDPNRFNEDFAGLEPELVDALHARGVILVGIDTPSVDLFSSKDLPAHARFLANDMAILEGLVLADVPEGTYELIALPLRLAGFDASPVRAVLRQGSH